VRKFLIVGVLGCLCSFAFADVTDEYVNTNWTGSYRDIAGGGLHTVTWQIVQGKGSLIVIENSQTGFIKVTYEYPAKIVDGILEFCVLDGVRWASLDADGNLVVAETGASLVMKPKK